MTKQQDSKLRASDSEIVPIPAAGRFIVTIDGKPYAGFIDRFHAEQAVKLWRGEIDGAGMPIALKERSSHGWRAIHGRKVEVVER